MGALRHPEIAHAVIATAGTRRRSCRARLRPFAPRRLRSWVDSRNDPPTGEDAAEYWEWRAKRYGAWGVLNLRRGKAGADEITEKQERLLLPIFRSLLNGNERLVLDFGCGPGRFTPLLAAAIAGVAVGVDPIAEYLRLAPLAPNVRYELLPVDGAIPFEDASVDAVWICLVLGALRGDVLKRAAAEIERVLRPGGALLIVETPGPGEDRPHWSFRDATFYQALFAKCTLAEAATYDDMDVKQSVLVGHRKQDGERREAPGASPVTAPVSTRGS